MRNELIALNPTVAVIICLIMFVCLGYIMGKKDSMAVNKSSSPLIVLIAIVVFFSVMIAQVDQMKGLLTFALGAPLSLMTYGIGEDPI